MLQDSTVQRWHVAAIRTLKEAERQELTKRLEEIDRLLADGGKETGSHARKAE
jgi:hypothetical protein